MRFSLLCAPVALLVALTPALAAAESGIYDAGPPCSFFSPLDGAAVIPADSAILLTHDARLNVGLTLSVDDVDTTILRGPYDGTYSYLKPNALLSEGRHALNISYTCPYNSARSLAFPVTVVAPVEKPTTVGTFSGEDTATAIRIHLDGLDPALVAYRYSATLKFQTTTGPLAQDLIARFAPNGETPDVNLVPPRGWRPLCEGYPTTRTLDITASAHIYGATTQPTPVTFPVTITCAGRVFADAGADPFDGGAPSKPDAGSSDGGGTSGDPDAPGDLGTDDGDDIANDNGCAIRAENAMPFAPTFGAIAVAAIGILRRRKSSN